MSFPTKEERECYEIEKVIEYYRALDCARKFEVIEKREGPDYIVRDVKTNEFFGVELTSLYLSDRSIPEEHIPLLNSEQGTSSIPLNRDELDEYEGRIIETVKTKIAKARKGYDLNYPLILSVYDNEYRSIFLRREDWQRIIDSNKKLFNDMYPFKEILFWGLANGDALLVTPDKNV